MERKIIARFSSKNENSQMSAISAIANKPLDFFAFRKIALF